MDQMERERHVFLAKIAEQAERFDEMVKEMSIVATEAGEHSPELGIEERNLLSVAYKNVIGSRRASWRIVSSIESREEQNGDERHAAIVHDYRASIERELNQICKDILQLLNKHLVPSAKSGESKVFYNKMKGDYHRYLAEFSSEPERLESAQESLRAYNEATTTAMSDLTPTHPIRLGLALNFSVFYYEILSSPQEACNLAKQAFDDAIAELDGLNEESYRDSTLIMQLLRDNLQLWTSDIPVDDDEETYEQGDENEYSQNAEQDATT